MRSGVDELLALARLRRSLPDPPLRAEIRKRARLTQQDIADAFGVDRATVTRWELGVREPREDDLDRYAELLARL